MYVTSTDDGEHWSIPQEFKAAGGGAAFPQVVIGLGEGFTIVNGTTTRLIMPAETYGPIYSDGECLSVQILVTVNW